MEIHEKTLIVGSLWQPKAGFPNEEAETSDSVMFDLDTQDLS